MLTQIDLIKSARGQYHAAFMQMARSTVAWHVYRSNTGVLIAEGGENFRILVKNVHAMAEETMVNALSEKLRRDAENKVDSVSGNKLRRKTAKINVHHVFGTKSTTAYRVEYRGKLLKSEMANDTPQSMLEKARTWAYSNGFSHVDVIYG